MAVTTFNYTGAVQYFTVPSDVGGILIDCSGAQSDAKGGQAKGEATVTPGEVLQVRVGGQGGYPSGGWNGGGNGFNNLRRGGGGASDVRRAPYGLADRLCVGGGGAGAGLSNPGLPGAGGGAKGGDGASGGARGGTQTSGYALGQGGPGGPSSDIEGFGGGGGYWGGFGGSGSGFNGGGGSGFTGNLTSAQQFNGVRSGNGVVVITATNVAPLAPTITSPQTNAYVFAADPCTVTFRHNDVGAMTRFDARWKIAGAGAWTTILNAGTSTQAYTLAGGTLTPGTQVEVQISTYDVGNLASPWSSSLFLNVINVLPAAVITTPLAGASLFLTPASLEWTTGGVPSDAYRVTRTDGAALVYYDSGEVPSTLAQASVPLDSIAGRTDTLTVSYRYAGHWSPVASVQFDSQFGPPTTPLLVLTQVSPTPPLVGVGVRVDVTNPPAHDGMADAMSNVVTRDGTPIAGVGVNGSYTDWMPGAGNRDYRVVSTAASGSESSSF